MLKSSFFDRKFVLPSFLDSKKIFFNRQISIVNKEAYFVECVKKAAKSLGLKFIPKVKIWEGACPYSDGNEIAHAHPDLGLICISRGKLESMSLDEIRETAFHETAHMLHKGHDTEFVTSMEDAHLIAWLEEHRPKNIVLKSKGKEKNKVDKKRCNYHLCRKKTKLYRCKYCGGYFCKEHIRPGLAIHRSAIDSIKDPVLRDKVYEEWRRNDKHPDIIWTKKYFEELKLKEEERREKFLEILDILKEKEPISQNVIIIDNIPVHIKKITHADGDKWYSWTYVFDNEKEAQHVYEIAKKLKRNVIEKRENDKNLIDIKLNNNSIFYNFCL